MTKRDHLDRALASIPQLRNALNTNQTALIDGRAWVTVNLFETYGTQADDPPSPRGPGFWINYITNIVVICVGWFGMAGMCIWAVGTVLWNWNDQGLNSQLIALLGVVFFAGVKDVILDKIMKPLQRDS